MIFKLQRNEQKFDSNKEAGNDSKNADKKANKFNNGQLLFSVGYIQDKETLEITGTVWLICRVGGNALRNIIITVKVTK